MKPKKVLGIFAHPDDEAFGPGGTLAKWAGEGIEIHLLCATKGEAGQCDWKCEISNVREQELKDAAQVLGIKSVTFLGFKDGEISNNHLDKLEKIISDKIRELKPDTLLTFDLNGVSGHLDHVAVASATTQSFKKTNLVDKLYYFVVDKAFTLRANGEDYFVHRPEGRALDQIDEIVNVEAVWDTKLKAMHAHKSQIHDVEWILKIREGLPKHEHFQIRHKNKP